MADEIKFDRRNYRKHSKKNKDLIKKSLRELGAGRSVVIDKEGELIAGNGVYEQAKALGMGVKIIETDGSELVVVKRTDLATEDTKRKQLALADNSASDSSEFDIDMLREDWSADVLADWGVDMPELEILYSKEKRHEKIEEAELLLNKAMKQYCGEFRQQLDDALSHGWIFQGMSKGYARLKFLRAKYYSERYERKNAVIFAPEIFLTPSQKKEVSYYEQLRISATNKNDAGIAGFRTYSSDGLLLSLANGGYPIGKSGSCADFPVEVARRLYAKYARAGRVLDPCAGWGGRQIGALLEEVSEYIGIDPSPIAMRAARDIYETFGEYQQTNCRFIQKPYERTTDDEVGTGFDFALTSPPYFDVENYQGGGQSHKEYNDFDLWVQKFYEPLIIITMRRLKDDGAFALQVGSQTYPLRMTAEEICKRNGFKIEAIETKVLNADALHGTSEEAGECILLITKS